MKGLTNFIGYKLKLKKNLIFLSSNQLFNLSMFLKITILNNNINFKDHGKSVIFSLLLLNDTCFVSFPFFSSFFLEPRPNLKQALIIFFYIYLASGKDPICQGKKMIGSCSIEIEEETSVLGVWPSISTYWVKLGNRGKQTIFFFFFWKNITFIDLKKWMLDFFLGFSIPKSN